MLLIMQSLLKNLIRENRQQTIGWISALNQFKSLSAHKDDIGLLMGMSLEWRELPERKANCILVEKNVVLDDRNKWSEQFDYIIDVCLKIKNAFKKYL